MAFVQSTLFDQIVYSREKTSVSEWNKLIDDSVIYEDKHYSLKHLLRWSDVCRVAFSKDMLLLPNMNASCITKEMSENAVQNYPLLFHFIPKKHQTKELFLLAIKDDISSIDAVPSEKLSDYLTEDSWKQAVHYNGNYLEYVPNELKTYEMCLAAVANDGAAYQFVPENQIDKKMYLTAITLPSAYRDEIHSLRKVPLSVIDMEICEAAINVDGKNLAYVPSKYITEKMCHDAVKNNRHSLKYVPEEYLSEELCLETIKGTIDVITAWIKDQIPSKCKTKTFYQMLYQKNTFIPPKMIPEECLTEDLCIKYLEVNKYRPLGQQAATLADIPIKFRTRRVCDYMMQADPYLSIRYVPDELITKEYLFLAAKYGSNWLKNNIPDRYINEEFYNELKNTYPQHDWAYLQNILEENSKTS